MKKNSISLFNALITLPTAILSSIFATSIISLGCAEKVYLTNFSSKNNFEIKNIWRNEINEEWIKEELFKNRNDVFVNFNVNSLDEMKEIVKISNINFDKFAIGIINFDCELNVNGFKLTKKINFNLHFNDILLNNARELTRPHSKFTSINKTNEIMKYYNNYPNTINSNEYFLRFVYGVQKIKDNLTDDDINTTINLIKKDLNNVNRMTKIVEVLVDIKLPINSLLYTHDDPSIYNLVKNEMKKVLDDFFTNYYYKEQTYVGNWWNYDIGVPRRLSAILPFLTNYYPFDDVVNWINTILWHTRNYENWTGGNLLDYSYLRAISFITINKIDKAKEIVDYAIDKIFGGWKDLKEGDQVNNYSFYRDGTYLDHDNVPYFGGYGVVLLDGLDKLRHMFQNSIYGIETNKNFENFYKIVETAIMPYFYDGVYSDSLGGRTITRASYLSERKNGMKILSLLSNFVWSSPSHYKDRLINFVLNNIESDVVEKYIDNNLKEFKSNYTEKVQISKRTIDTTWSELDLFNNSKNILFGYDAFMENNKMWFAKNQDRFVIKRDNFMVNISLSSTRTKRFEMINKENIFGYYFGAGRTLINNKNSESYDWEYNLGVDPFKIPGTSSVYEFDNQNMANNEIEKRFNEYYSIARETNKGFSNGIVMDGMGLISANINSYNPNYQLWTKKNYVVIDDVIIVVGDVDKTKFPTDNGNLNVYTTIANEKNDIKFSKKTINSNSKNYDKYYSTLNNSYYVLGNNESIVNNKATRNMNNQTTNLTNASGNKSFNFNELYFNHSNGDKKDFAYAIAPNEISEEKTLNIINNIKYDIQDNYIIIEYLKDDSKYYFVSTKDINQNITLDNISLLVENKTSFILHKKNNDIKMVMSPNEEIDKYKIKINNGINNVVVKNNNEVEYLGGYINIDNRKNKFNDILHNSWIKFSLS